MHSLPGIVMCVRNALLSACENVFLTAMTRLPAQGSNVGRNEDHGRADADRSAATGPMGSGWLRSVTESAGRGTNAAERLVERAPAEALCNGCFPGIHEGQPCR